MDPSTDHHPGERVSPGVLDTTPRPRAASDGKVRLLNIEFDNLTMEELLARFDRGMMCTVHSDMLMRFQKDREFYELYKTFEYVVCDSQILTFATRLLGTPVKERVSGSDFLPRFYDYHRSNPDITLFLLGGLEGVADRARELINAKVGREMVVGSLSPPVGAEKSPAACQEMVDQVNESKASVLVVGMGAPKQEYFIRRHGYKMPYVRIFLPLGGALDYEAGTMKRPAPWVTNAGLEWAYRILQEPGKRWKRYLVDDIPVVLLILKQKLGLYTNPFESSEALS